MGPDTKMSQPDHSVRRPHGHRQIVFIAGLVLLLVAATGYVWIQTPLKNAITLERQLAKNIGRIMTLDETLTMSARMAAAARNPAYEARYNANVDELDAVIKATLALVPDDEVAAAVATTDAANLRLVEMETRSFKLDKADQHAEALGLLEGEAYRSDKEIYASGMRTAFERLEHITAASRMSAARWALVLQVTAVLALIAVVAVWLLEQREQRRRAAAYASELEATVATRTAELAQRNRGMRLVLDNVAQGFVTIDLHGAIAPERSAIVDRWFGVPAPGATLSGHLGKLTPEFAEWLQLGLVELRDGIMPAELTLAQLPHRFAAGARTFDVAYSPITTGDAIQSLLVIISDVTARLAHERVEREQRDLVSLFQRISIDRSGVEDFLTEAAGLLDALRREVDPVIQKRLVHTLKGNCAIYGLQSYAEFAHVVESELGNSDEPLAPEHRDGLVTMWKEAMARVAPLLGASRRDFLDIERTELDLAIAQAAAAPRDLQDLLTSWTREPMARRFERLSRQIASMSRRLGRPEPIVRTTGDDVRLEHDAWQPFWTAMVHAVRNAVDHGIESPEERQLAGKPEAGIVELTAERQGGRLLFSLRDDGRGIAWDRVRAKAVERGLPAATHDDLVQALFVDGLSTRDTVSEMSGRGVGLSALRQTVDALGGTIQVDSMPGQGTTFRFSFDERVALATTAAATEAALRNRRTSLLPFRA
jgi:two-component sensor histidine kinase/HPt (histidine-containing phosphotransfer) domain-containing protein